MKEFNYFAPGSVEEALELMKEYEGKYTILNGGTDVMIRLRERLINPEAVIDIKRIPGLKEITFSKKDGLYIGACVTCKEISESEIVKENYPFYAQAASVLGSQLVRGRATSVGNVINASPLADTVTPLVACDAKLVVVGPEGQREVSLVSWAGESQEERIARGAFFIFVRKVGLKPGEMAIGLKIPYVEGQKAVFTKFDRRKEVDLSTVCATVGKFGEYSLLAFHIGDLEADGHLAGLEADLTHEDEERAAGDSFFLAFASPAHQGNLTLTLGTYYDQLGVAGNERSDGIRQRRSVDDIADTGSTAAHQLGTQNGSRLSVEGVILLHDLTFRDLLAGNACANVQAVLLGESDLLQAGNTLDVDHGFRVNEALAQTNHYIGTTIQDGILTFVLFHQFESFFHRTRSEIVKFLQCKHSFLIGFMQSNTYTASTL